MKLPLPFSPFALLALSAGLAAQASPAAPAAQAAAVQAKAAEVQAKAAAAQKYQQGLDFINDAQWNKALAAMDDAQQRLGYQADAALYWQAYAESKLGRANAALKALADMKRSFPNSAWQNDAEALALELRQAAGQPVSPATQPNDDLKLLAINGLMQSDPAQALPLLEKLVQGTASPAVKKRALFVLAQNHSPGAINALVQVAQSHADPGLGEEAVRYLGMMGGERGRAALARIYAGPASLPAKQDILRAYMIGGDRARLLAAAQGEANPQLQQEAIRDLALAGGKAELWQLYQANPPLAAKREIIRALGLTGDLEHLIPLAQSETNPALRADAIRSLGLSGSAKAQDALLALYTGAHDRAASEAIIQALFLHNSAAALVGLARKETDPQLKRRLVTCLSLMHSKAATQYLMELLNK
ncbi:MAG TPA: HEAT repeat domain-containing protein [Terriglobales bacterium]|nr:HEAT repeat domain-containing protein [Terriglobales bacterium]